MNIIKKGKIKNENTVTFRCEKCGCEFECEKDEYWVDNTIALVTSPCQYYVYSNCPTCHKVCRSTKYELTQSAYSVTLENGVVLGDKI